MRTQIRVISPDMTLTRLLDGLERELLEASDQEILDAAKELGMDPTMKGSAAFLGLKYGYFPRLADFFGDLTALAEVRARAREKVGRAPGKRKNRKGPPK